MEGNVEMGLFSLRRDFAGKLEVLTGILNDEREQRLESQRLLTELLEKANKKQSRTEALCEDILETISKGEESPGVIPFELFSGIMEYFELLLHYCALSRDEALAGQVPLLTEKADFLLNEYGIEKICEVGVPADPELHKIERTEEPPSPELNKTVAEVLTSGYRMSGKVLQKAKVTAFVKKNGGNGL
jgi:hypothetical protein